MGISEPSITGAQGMNETWQTTERGTTVRAEVRQLQCVDSIEEVILGRILVVRKMYSRGSVKSVEPRQLVLLFRTKTKTAEGEKLTHETQTGQLFKTLPRNTLRMEG